MPSGPVQQGVHVALQVLGSCGRGELGPFGAHTGSDLADLVLNQRFPGLTLKLYNVVRTAEPKLHFLKTLPFLGFVVHPLH